jgi:hypothetical protein
MRNLSKLLAVSAAGVGVMLATAPAHAVTFTTSLAPSTIGLPSTPSAVIPKGAFVQNTNTYDFTFSTLGGTYVSLMQAQASKVKNGVPAALAFALYSGSPGTGTWVADSGGTPTAATLRIDLGPGNYYLSLDTHNAPKELLTGGITLLSAVPEPASWAIMLVGLSGLGAMTRTRRRVLATAAI